MNNKVFNHKRLDDNDLSFYRDKGYLVIKDVLTDTGLQQIRHECMEAWVEEKGDFDPMRRGSRIRFWSTSIIKHFQ